MYALKKKNIKSTNTDIFIQPKGNNHIGKGNNHIGKGNNHIGKGGNHIGKGGNNHIGKIRVNKFPSYLYDKRSHNLKMLRKQWVNVSKNRLKIK